MAVEGEGREREREKGEGGGDFTAPAAKVDRQQDPLDSN